jgi:hypothetical protein
MMNDMDNDPKVIPLRTIQLEDVAAFLKCDPERLRTVLKRLAENPSVIKYGRSDAARHHPGLVGLQARLLRRGKGTGSLVPQIGQEGRVMAKLIKGVRDRFAAERRARCDRYKKPSSRKINRDARAAERSRQWCLARLNLPGGDAKDVL